MHKVTDEQVDFILDDIKANGVTIDDLRYNLLDHICCIIENEMDENEDFYKFYERILPRFFKNEMKEIEEETNLLLKFKHYYAMKKTLKISGIASSLLLLIGALFKTMHWPGAGVMFVSGAFFFCFLFLPLMIALKFRDENKSTDKWVFTFGFLLAMMSFLGFGFKIMHWPYANFLMRWSLTFFVFGYVPLYYITRVRRVEEKFNSTINAVLMMAAGGMLYALINLGPSSNVTESVNASYLFMKHNSESLLSANENLLASSPEELHDFHQKTTSLYNRIDNAKANLIAKVDGVSIEEARKRDIASVEKPNEFSKVHHYFTMGDDEYSLKAITDDIEAYNAMVKSLFPENKEKVIAIEKLQLDRTILSVVLHELSQIQLQIATNQNGVLNQIAAK